VSVPKRDQHRDFDVVSKLIGRPRSPAPDHPDGRADRQAGGQKRITGRIWAMAGVHPLQWSVCWWVVFNVAVAVVMTRQVPLRINKLQPRVFSRERGAFLCGQQRASYWLGVPISSAVFASALNKRILSASSRH
jgi:hypothetical protein